MLSPHNPIPISKDPIARVNRSCTIPRQVATVDSVASLISSALLRPSCAPSIMDREDNADEEDYLTMTFDEPEVSRKYESSVGRAARLKKEVSLCLLPRHSMPPHK
jgi:hypothetical protein